MTALYLERYMNYGITPEELRGGKPIIGIAQTGSDLSPCNRHHIELASRCAMASAQGCPLFVSHCPRITVGLEFTKKPVKIDRGSVD